jgi:hypothetical protein
MAPFSIREGDSLVQGDFSRLEGLIAELKTNHSVEIGVFKTAKTSDGHQVAEYGAYNEFGSISGKLPKRSFIRMPLTKRQAKIEAKVRERVRAHLEAGDIKAIFKDIGIGGEAAIQEAFDTRGFGTWAPDAEITVERKGSDAPLIDIGLLRNSVGNRVG